MNTKYYEYHYHLLSNTLSTLILPCGYFGSLYCKQQVTTLLTDADNIN